MRFPLLLVLALLQQLLHYPLAPVVIAQDIDPEPELSSTPAPSLPATSMPISRSPTRKKRTRYPTRYPTATKRPSATNSSIDISFETDSPTTSPVSNAPSFAPLQGSAPSSAPLQNSAPSSAPLQGSAPSSAPLQSSTPSASPSHTSLPTSSPSSPSTRLPISSHAPSTLEIPAVGGVAEEAPLPTSPENDGGTSTAAAIAPASFAWFAFLAVPMLGVAIYVHKRRRHESQVALAQSWQQVLFNSREYLTLT